MVIYTSDDEAFGRHIIAEPTDEPCRFCHRRGRSVRFDVSMDEYLDVVVCGDCVSELSAGRIPSVRS